MMVDRLGTNYNLPLHETPVGFNHIADYMLNERRADGWRRVRRDEHQGAHPGGGWHPDGALCCWR